MNIRKKLVFLLFGISLLFAGLFTFYVRYERARLTSIFKNVYQEREIVFREIINLLSSPLERLVLTQTYWDEMALFAQGAPGAALPIKNIDVYLKENDVEGLWVYNDDGVLRYSHNNLNIAGLAELPISRQVMKSLFSHGKTCRFFIQSPRGFLEIRGAMIHPSDDFERKTPSRGYLFVGKLYDPAYCARIASLSRSQVVIHEPGMRNASGMRAFSESTMQFEYMLPSWNGTPAGFVQGIADPVFMKSFNRVSTYSFFILFLFIVSILFISIVFLKRWVIGPLHLVFQALGSQNGAYVHSLLSHTDDFGDIARLIAYSFVQKDALVAEMGNRLKLETEARRARQRFLELFEDFSNGIVIYEARDEGKDFIFSNFNKAAERIEGIRKEELLGKSVLVAFPVLKESGFIEVMQRVYRTGTSEKYLGAANSQSPFLRLREIYVHKVSESEIVVIGSPTGHPVG